MLAENGETKKLEIDMKSSSQNIRSVIKARFLILLVFFFFFNPVSLIWMSSGWQWCMVFRSLIQNV